MLSGLLKHTPKLTYLLKDNSTLILTGMGAVGTVATAYLTGRATFRAADIIAEAEKVEVESDLPILMEDDSVVYRDSVKIDLQTATKIQLVWKHYIPAVVMGGITITSIIAAHKISSAKIAALITAAGISDRALNEYKAKVIEKFGERKETDIRDEIAQNSVTNNPPSHEIVFAGTGEVICFDSLTGRYFQSTMEDIKKAENKLNFEILHYNYASLTFFYDEIGLQPTDYTDSVGWNEHVELEYSTTLTPRNQPCIVINFKRNPIPDYDKSWR